MDMQVTLSGKAADVVKAQVASGIYKDAVAFISDIVLKYEAYLRRNSKRSIERSPSDWSKPTEANVSSLILMNSCKKLMRNWVMESNEEESYDHTHRSLGFEGN